MLSWEDCREALLRHRHSGLWTKLGLALNTDPELGGGAFASRVNVFRYSGFMLSKHRLDLKRLAPRLALGLASTVLVLAIGEAGGRFLHTAPQYPDTSSEDQFWRFDEHLGWARTPNTSGVFSNGYFRGEVTIDKWGNRSNGSGLVDLGSPEVLFIGDSTTASLEVDDDQTVPALLEQAYRLRGLSLNVRNLGVRGYGTDQSVRNAVLQARIFRPREIIYMFSSNDIFDNQTIHQPGRRYGKGAYILAGATLEPHNYPVPKASPAGEVATVVIAPDGKPEVVRRAFTPNASRAWKWVDTLCSYSRLAEIVVRLKRKAFPTAPLAITGKQYSDGLTDPYVVRDEVHGDMLFALLFGLDDGGALRTSHRHYYDRHFEALLKMLREESAVAKLHLVEFPSPVSIGRLKAGKQSDNEVLFRSLFTKGVIDSYVNLNRHIIEQDLDLSDLQCPGDGHFCAAGTEWITDTLLRELPEPLKHSTAGPES